MLTEKSQRPEHSEATGGADHTAKARAHGTWDIPAVYAALCGRNRPVDVDCDALESRLMEILERHGIVEVTDEFARIFLELSDEDGPHSEEFRKIQGLAADLRARINQFSTSGRLNSLARSLLSSRQKKERYGGLASAAAEFRFSSEASAMLEIIGELADRLSHYEATQVRAGRPVDEVIDDLLLELADLFIELRGSDLGRWDVPHSVGSVFIRFAAAALKPFFDPTQSSPKALSNRWLRIKRHHRPLTDPHLSRSQNLA